MNNLPYMGELTFDNRPRRGRKPKKADICHLISKNYGIQFPTPLSAASGSTSTKCSTVNSKSSSSSTSVSGARENKGGRKQAKQSLEEASKRVVPDQLRKEGKSAPLNLPISITSIDDRSGGNSAGRKLACPFPSNWIQQPLDLIPPSNGSNGTFPFSFHPLLSMENLWKSNKTVANLSENHPRELSSSSSSEEEDEDQPLNLCTRDSSVPQFPLSETNLIEHLTCTPSLLITEERKKSNLNRNKYHLESTESSKLNVNLPSCSNSEGSKSRDVHLVNKYNENNTQGEVPYGRKSSSSVNIGYNGRKRSRPEENPSWPSTDEKHLSSSLSESPPATKPSRLKKMRKGSNGKDGSTQGKKQVEESCKKSEDSNLLFGSTPAHHSAQVSICKFKFTGGAKPSLQEKKMLSVDSGGKFRFYSDKNVASGASLGGSKLSRSGNQSSNQSPFAESAVMQCALKDLPKSAKSMSMCMPIQMLERNEDSGGALAKIAEPKPSTSSTMTTRTRRRGGSRKQIGYSNRKRSTVVTPQSFQDVNDNELTNNSCDCYECDTVEGKKEPDASLTNEPSTSFQHLKESGTDLSCHSSDSNYWSKGTGKGGKRRTRKSVMREKLEKTFQEKGFLIKTQQLESAQGATYCKFRQLRKFTRYLFRSWKDYLPDTIKDITPNPSSSALEATAQWTDSDSKIPNGHSDDEEHSLDWEPASLTQGNCTQNSKFSSQESPASSSDEEVRVKQSPTPNASIPSKSSHDIL